MPKINSVRGPIDTSRLGTTLMHEHLLLKSPGIAENWPHLFDEEAAWKAAVRSLEQMEERGVGTLVDVTTADLGRDVQFMRRLQDVTAINIVCCTGIHFLPPLYWWMQTPEEMAAVFIKDIDEGVQGTEIRAAIIKVASDQYGPDPKGIAQVNERCLKAAAQAHMATGVPIITHASPPTLGRHQQEVFKSGGVDLTRVIIGHVGDTADIDFLKELMDEGSSIGMDRFGYESILGLDERIETVVKLCRDGYQDRIVLSHDAIGYSNWATDRVYRPDPQRDGAFNCIPDQVLPMLRDKGVTDAQVEQMLVGNPRRLFEQQGAY